MGDPVLDQPKKLTREDFISRVKSLSPDYARIPDDELYDRVINRYPIYLERIQEPEQPSLYERVGKALGPTFDKVSDAFFNKKTTNPVDGSVANPPHRSQGPVKPAHPDHPDYTVDRVGTNEVLFNTSLPGVEYTEERPPDNTEVLFDFFSDLTKDRPSNFKSEMDLMAPQVVEVHKKSTVEDIISMIPEPRSKRGDSKVRNLGSDFANSVLRANVQTKIDAEMFNVAMSPDGADYFELNRALEKLDALEQADPTISGGFIRKGVVTTGAMLPAMGKGTAQGLVGGAGAAGVTFLAGQAVPLPEEVVTVPIAFKAGQMTGSAQYWYRQGAGSIYADLRREGIDHDISSIMAMSAGVPYAAIEFSQVGKVVPGLKKSIKPVIVRSTRQAMKELTRKYGKDWIHNVSEEVLQEIVVQQAKNIASAVSNEIRGTKLEKLPFRDQLVGMWDTAVDTAVPMALLLVPGNAAQARKRVRMAKTAGLMDNKEFIDRKAKKEPPPLPGRQNKDEQAKIIEEIASRTGRTVEDVQKEVSDLASSLSPKDREAMQEAIDGEATVQDASQEVSPVSRVTREQESGYVEGGTDSTAQEGQEKASAEPAPVQREEPTVEQPPEHVPLVPNPDTPADVISSRLDEVNLELSRIDTMGQEGVKLGKKWKSYRNKLDNERDKLITRFDQLSKVKEQKPTPVEPKAKDETLLGESGRRGFFKKLGKLGATAAVASTPSGAKILDVKKVTDPADVKRRENVLKYIPQFDSLYKIAKSMSEMYGGKAGDTAEAAEMLQEVLGHYDPEGLYGTSWSRDSSQAFAFALLDEVEEHDVLNDIPMRPYEAINTFLRDSDSNITDDPRSLKFLADVLSQGVKKTVSNLVSSDFESIFETVKQVAPEPTPAQAQETLKEAVSTPPKPKPAPSAKDEALAELGLPPEHKPLVPNKKTPISEIEDRIDAVDAELVVVSEKEVASNGKLPKKWKSYQNKLLNEKQNLVGAHTQAEQVREEEDIETREQQAEEEIANQELESQEIEDPTPVLPDNSEITYYDDFNDANADGWDLHKVHQYKNLQSAKQAVGQLQKRHPELGFAIANEQWIYSKDPNGVTPSPVAPAIEEVEEEIKPPELLEVEASELDPENINFSQVVGQLPDDLSGYQFSAPVDNGLRLMVTPEGSRYAVKGMNVYSFKEPGSADTSPIPSSGAGAVTSPVTSAGFGDPGSPKPLTFENPILQTFDVDVSHTLAGWDNLHVGQFSADELSELLVMDIESMHKSMTGQDINLSTKEYEAIKSELNRTLEERLGHKLSREGNNGTMAFPNQGNVHTNPHAYDPFARVPYEAANNMVPSRLETSGLGTPATSGGSIGIYEILSSLEESIKTLGRNVPIRTGKTGKNQGIFLVGPELARINSVQNIPAATHEIGHAVMKVLAPAMRGMPSSAKVELIQMGKDLYGDTPPQGGYRSEGFAEFFRRWLTTDEDMSLVAPNTRKYLEESIFHDFPEFKESVLETKGLINRYRTQGPEARLKSMITNKKESGFAKIKKIFSKNSLKKNWVDQGDPLNNLVKVAEELSGEEIPLAEDPYQTMSALRYTHTARTRYMVDEGMIDLAGNVVGRPLNDLQKIVKPREREDFTRYLVAKRSQERLNRGFDPGISREDADYMVAFYEENFPHFELGAGMVYDWNKGVLNYALQSGLLSPEQYDRITSMSDFYVPMQRVFDTESIDKRKSRKLLGGDPVKVYRGSGRPIRDVLQVMIENAETMIRKSHQKVVVDQVIKMAGHEGMGHQIVKVPRDMVPKEFTLERVKKQLEEAGVDLDDAEMDATLKFFIPAPQPKGGKLIIPVLNKNDKGENKVDWYEVEPELYESMMSTDMYRLPFVLDMILGMPTRAFRLGTTGLRASFALVKNPMRDVPSFIMQTHTEKNPATLFLSWLASAAEVTKHPVHKSRYFDLFRRLGGEMALPLGVDTNPTRRATKGLFHGKVFKTVTSPIEVVRDVLQIPESTTRVTELKNVAKEMGWKPGNPLTFEQSLELLLKSKRVTTDFTASGRIGQVMNQMVAFFNPGIQGPRTFLRTFKKHPTRSVMRGLTLLTVPTLANWWRNKDEEWYQDAPLWERFTYWMIPDKDSNTVWRIPKPFDWGNVFAVLPEAMIDSWYRQDPEMVKAAFGHIFETTNPAQLPVMVQMAKEQYQNRVDFTDRPIVPQSQVDLPPGDQRGPYTSKLATFLGDVFPEKASPRRIDHSIRSIFGGLGPDLLDTLGIGTPKRTGEPDKANTPVIGDIFRRGGKGNSGSRSVDALYEHYRKEVVRRNSERVRGTEETNLNKARRMILKDATDTISVLSFVQTHATRNEVKTRIQEEKRRIAKHAMHYAERPNELRREQLGQDQDHIRSKFGLTPNMTRSEAERILRQAN